MKSTTVVVFEDMAIFYNKLKEDKNNDLGILLADFIEKCLTSKIDTKYFYTDDFAKCIKEANDAISNMIYLLEEYKGLSPYTNKNKTTYTQWFMYMITSMYLYEFVQYVIKYEERQSFKYSNLLVARDMFEEIASECRIDSGMQEGIFSTIESSSGFKGPIKLKPIPDSPSDVFCLAILLTKKGIAL